MSANKNWSARKTIANVSRNLETSIWVQSHSILALFISNHVRDEAYTFRCSVMRPEEICLGKQLHGWICTDIMFNPLLCLQRGFEGVYLNAKLSGMRDQRVSPAPVGVVVDPNEQRYSELVRHFPVSNKSLMCSCYICPGLVTRLGPIIYVTSHATTN